MKNKLLSVILIVVMGVYSLSWAASAAYALPEVPGTPETPTTPTSPPQLPNNAPQTQGDNTSQPQNQTPTNQNNENQHRTSGDNLSNAPSENVTSNTPNVSNNSSDVATEGSPQETGSVQNPDPTEPTVSITDLESSNNNTGATSENTAGTNVGNKGDTNIDNSANLDNLVRTSSNSGKNIASENTGDGIISSGDADVIVTAINAANNLNVGLETFNVFDDQTGDIVIDFNNIKAVPIDELSASSSNNTTGAGSENTANVIGNGTNSLTIDDKGNIVNNYVVDANTGKNAADKNTGDGGIQTGDANAILNLVNFLNNSLQGAGELLIGNVNIFGTLTGDIVLQGLQGTGVGMADASSLSSSNNTTGTSSTNNALTSITNANNASLINLAGIDNNITADANTGDNVADKNTGGGQITTGDSNAKVVTTNIANTNTAGNGGTIWIVLTNNLGKWTGQLFNTSSSIYSPFFTFTLNPDGTFSAANTATGANSTNTANTTVGNTNDVQITNSASVTNNVTIDANTGKNSASKNTGSGLIQTGDAKVVANILNIINNNFAGSRVLLTIVNIFGSFLGNIRDGKPSSTVAAQNTVGASPEKTVAANAGPSTTHTSPLRLPQQMGTSNAPESNGNTKSNVVVLGSNSGPTDGSNNSPIDRVSAAPGLFDNFKLIYLVIPLLIASLLVITRRVLVRR